MPSKQTATSPRSKSIPGLPTSLKIGAYTYKVYVSDEILKAAQPECEDPDCDGHGPDAVAAGNAALQAIILSEGKGPDFTADSLLHEVLHQCSYLGNSNLPDDEPFVAAVAGVLLQVLRDNPKLYSFLLKPSGT